MEVITLNKQLFSNTCAELASKIDIQPDLVVGILNGGGYVVNEIKQNHFKKAHFQVNKIQKKNRIYGLFCKPFSFKFISQ